MANQSVDRSDLLRRVAATARRPVAFTFRTGQDRVALAVLAVAGAYVYYANLGGYPLQSWDEGLYANIARGVLRGGPWLVPRVTWVANGVVGPITFLEKPPGMFWLEALSMAVFGATEFGARFPSATFAIATGLLAYVFGRELFDRRAGFVAGLVWLTTPYLFGGMNGGRNGATDTAFVFFGTLLLFFAWKGYVDDRTYLAYAGVPAGAVFLVKGLALGLYGLLLVPLVVADLFGDRRSLGREAAVGVASALVIAVPWPLLAWLEHGDELVYELYREQVLSRLRGQHGHEQPGTLAFMRFPYFRRLPSFFDPWLYFLPSVAIVALLRRARPFGTRVVDRHARFRELSFLAWWTVFVLAFFVRTGNHAWYLLPMYVPAGLLVGWLVSLASSRSGGDRLLAGVGLWIGGALVALFSFRIGLWPLTAYRHQGHLPGGAGFGLVFGIALLTLVIEPDVTSFLQRRLPAVTVSRVRTVGFVALALLFVSVTAAPVELGGAPIHDQQKAVGTLVDAQAPANATVYVSEGATRGEAFHALAFYANRPFEQTTMRRIESSDRVKYLFARENTVTSLQRDYRTVGTIRDDGVTYYLVSLARSKRGSR